MAEASNRADELVFEPSEHSPEDDAQENCAGAFAHRIFTWLVQSWSGSSRSPGGDARWPNR